MRDCEIRANSRWISLPVLCILIVDVNYEWFISRNFPLRWSSEESSSPDALPLTYLPRSHRGMFASRRQIGNAWFIDETCELWSRYEWRKHIYPHLPLMSVITLCQQTQRSLSSYKSDSTSFRFFITFLHCVPLWVWWGTQKKCLWTTHWKVARIKVFLHESSCRLFRGFSIRLLQDLESRR